jgi:heme-degrading monooxygenase HmoA
MIARLWRGWTASESADSYERMLREDVLPGVSALEGYRGSYILRSDENQKTAFVIVTLFESEPPFSGGNDTESRQLLSLFESTASHYEVKMIPTENA